MVFPRDRRNSPPPSSPRHPSYVWPVSAIAALGLHGLGVGWWYRQQIVQASPPPAPVELVTLTDTGLEPGESPLLESPDPDQLPDVTLPTPAPPDPAPLSSDHLPSDVPALEPQPRETVPFPDAPSRNAPSPAPPPSAPAAPRPQPPAPPRPAPPSPTAPATNGSGTAVWTTRWAVSRDLQGRDLPDTIPQLPPGWQLRNLALADYPHCSPGNLSLEGISLRVVLRLTVSPEGAIEAASVVGSSGDQQFDQAIACIVASQTTPLIPAITAGEPIRSDAVLLEVIY